MIIENRPPRPWPPPALHAWFKGEWIENPYDLELELRRCLEMLTGYTWHRGESL